MISNQYLITELKMKIKLAIVLICVLAVPGVVVAQTAKSDFFTTSDGIKIH